MKKAEGFHEAIEEFVVATFRAMKSAQESAEAKLLDWRQSLDLSRGGIDKLAEATRSESVFDKLMEQVELNQPVVLQVAIEVEDEEGGSIFSASVFLFFSPSIFSSIAPTPKPRKAPQVIVKSEENKPEVKAMPRKAEKETRYEDDEEEKKKARYESRPVRPEGGEMVPKELLSVPVTQETWNGQGLKIESFV